MIWSSRTVFQKAFKSVFGFYTTATNDEIDAYYGKGLTGKQAALLFNATPLIPAADLKTDGTIEYNGMSYDMKTPDGIANLVAAKNASAALNEKNNPEISVAFCKDCSSWINKENLIHFCYKNEFDLKNYSREEENESSKDEIETISLKELEEYQLEQTSQIEINNK